MILTTSLVWFSLLLMLLYTTIFFLKSHLFCDVYLMCWQKVQKVLRWLWFQARRVSAGFGFSEQLVLARWSWRGSGVWLTLRAKWAEPLEDISSGRGREEDTHNRGARRRGRRGRRAERCSWKTHQNDEKRPKMWHWPGQMMGVRHGLDNG